MMNRIPKIEEYERSDREYWAPRELEVMKATKNAKIARAIHIGVGLLVLALALVFVPWEVAMWTIIGLVGVAAFIALMAGAEAYFKWVGRQNKVLRDAKEHGVMDDE